MRQILFFIILLHFLWAEHNYTNALIKEHSPYLQQHAHNPVNWYPWGKEALTRAKRENKLIFLSIGYSTCHWCHVMEKESFIDADIAKILNEHFISIKVDREEYPQLDKKYQKRYMELKGKRGGWPLSLFLSPDMKLFYLATYIPKEEGYGSKGLENLLPSFVSLYQDKKAFKEAIQKHKKKEKNKTLKKTLSTKIIDKVVAQITKQFDSKNGGFSNYPKFPEASKLELLLDIYQLNGNKKALSMVEHTLTKMAQGGIYDQIGGGFFRYTTDSAWQIPHFEKMLYSNAQLIAVYVRLYKIDQRALYKKVVEQSIAQIEENFMQEGLYFSATDADSDGEEGGYFIYAYTEVEEALKQKGWGAKEIEDTLAYIGIEENGNIDGDFSHTHITNCTVPPRLDELKAYLKSLSNKRTFPFIDKKINTAWNAMMIKALFVATKIDKKYLVLAKRSMDALLSRMRDNGVLYHQTLLGKTPKQKALLEDYAFLIDALIEGYERTYDEKYLTLIQTLTKETLNKFYKKKHWYLSDDEIKAYADFDDRYYTSALSMMLENLLRTSALTEELRYIKIVKQSIKKLGSVLEKDPASAPKLVDTFLRLKKGDIIIHASKKKLLLAQDDLDAITYPFILSKAEASKQYLACKSTSCFAHDKNITKLIDKIKKVVE
jgi:uncharacterized protein YyaL (SSP411 family)